MPLYSDLIMQEKEYNYSANIQFDIESDKKLARFIPNETTIELLKEYFIDITRSSPSCHSRILCGSYGTGKSHFLTVLSMLLSKTFTNGEAFNTFITRVEQFDENLANDIATYVNDCSKKPMLVVPIVFDFDSFERCIYFSLKRKLDSIGIKVSFKTFFDQASVLVTQWKSNDESKERLENACEKYATTIDEVEKKLLLLDKEAEPVFQSIFSEMTYGVKYIYEVSNLSESINQTNNVISNQYSGILFVFDEFGRYIEDNIKSIKVKSVQDLAEYCDHCDGNNHILLVTHKEISQYTQKFGKSIANEWKKVEGRYKSTPINDHPDQCLSLIKNVLQKDDGVWNRFKESYKMQLDNMFSEAADFRGFMLDSSNGENPFEGGYPLHPISLFALDKLSKKVAQNERTFFTYLASKEENSLYSFLARNELNDFHFVGIDEIYDYFEPSIRSVQSDSSYQWYKNLLSAVSKNGSKTCDSTPEVKILKVIATIGIINDSSALVSDKQTILRVIDCPKDIISNALEGLCESKIIKYSGAYNRYDFYEASIFDVEAMIQDGSQLVTNESVVNVLNEEFVDFVLYPNEYNRDFKITRVFIPTFATAQELQKKTFTNKFGKYYDGVLVMLLQEQDDDLESITNLSKELDRVIIFSNKNVDELISLSKKYISVKYLETQKSTYTSRDPAFEKELEYYKDELRLSITARIRNWKTTFNEDIDIIYLGLIQKNVKAITDLSKIASSSMYASFPKTLIVNNELINKNNISGTITAAKKNALANIVQGHSSVNYFNLPLLSPDYIAVRSVLVKNGLIATSENEINENTLKNGERPQIEVAKLINNYIARSKKETVEFDKLIFELKQPPYGLRSGYLSLLIASSLITYKKSLIITSHGVEQEVSADLFEEIIKRPHDFVFTIASWSNEQVDYLESLENIFNQYIDETSLSKNRLKAIYDAMMSHYKGITKFARTTQKYITESTKAYRNLLEKSSANYSTFIFSKLKGLYGDYESTINSVKQAKTELESAISMLTVEISDSICDLMKVPCSQSIGNVFCEIYQSSWETKRAKSFDYYTNTFLEFASKVNKSDPDMDIIIGLSKVLTGFELMYWNDSHKEEFISRLREILDKINSYDEKSALSDGETKLVIADSKGTEKNLVFERSELNPIAQSLKNKINATFDNFGRAITYDNKVQILLSLIEELMEGK